MKGEELLMGNCYVIHDLEELLDELSKGKILGDGYFINEGDGFIPFTESKVFNRAMKNS